MPAPLFSRRHYEWLAAFAGRVLDEEQFGLLCNELCRDNPAFERARFVAAFEKAWEADRIATLVRINERITTS